MVELLVVIVIISMLVGLLMPALMAARGRARIAQCTNNQHELSTAIHAYDLAKKRLPGYANRVHGANIGWVPVLFPFIGRNDLWEGPNGNNGWRNIAPAPAPHIGQLVCPDDPIASAEPDSPCLSYVLNVGSAAKIIPANEYASGNGGYQNGLFRNLFQYPEKTVSLSSIKSPSQRPMISERYRIDDQNAPRYWNVYDSANNVITAQLYGFNYISGPNPYELDGTNPVPLTTMLINNPLVIPSTNHPGIIIVTFCDGSTKSLSDDTAVDVYDYSALK